MSPLPLQARYVFPVAAGPIVEGTVAIEGERIAAVGHGPSHGERLDLGNVAILPGLINVHTHLEFSERPAPLGRPGMGFVDWLKEVVLSRRPNDRRGAEGVAVGLDQCARHGVTALGEIAQPEWPRALLEEARTDITLFLELIAPTAERAEAALAMAHQHLSAAGNATRWTAGLSPHAPYSVRWEVIAEVAALSAKTRAPVAMHLAESREELELLRSGSGPLRDFLEMLGAWDPSAWVEKRRPLDYLRLLAVAHRSLVVHGNYLNDEEIAFLGRHRDRMAVAYCPRTHAWFQHDPHPLERLLAAGATVALGTDSRASSPDLSLLAEMRSVRRKHPSIPGDRVLSLGTIEAAKALGTDRDTGSLEPGKRADLAIVALPDETAADPHDLLFSGASRVVGRWYRGRPD